MREWVEEKITINQKLFPKEVEKIRKMARTAEGGIFRGNITQFVRFKLLGVKPKVVRKTTRTKSKKNLASSKHIDF